MKDLQSENKRLKFDEKENELQEMKKLTICEKISDMFVEVYYNSKAAPYFQFAMLNLGILILSGVGGAIFYMCEYSTESDYIDYRTELRKQIVQEIDSADLEVIDDWGSVSQSFADANMWELRYAAFFAATTFTTIGFGFQAPKTSAGRYMVIVFGIPAIICYMFLARAIGDITLSLFFGFLNRTCLPAAFVKKWRVTIIVFALIFLSLVMSLLILVTATDEGFGNGIYKFEHSLYFLWTTTSTIGYGDVMMSGSNLPMTGMIGIWLASTCGVFLCLIGELNSKVTKKTSILKRKSMALQALHRIRSSQSSSQIFREKSHSQQKTNKKIILPSSDNTDV